MATAVATEGMLVAPDSRFGHYAESQEMPPDIGTDDLLTMAGIDFEVAIRPLYVGHEGGADLVPNFVATARTDTDGVLGVVSPSYEPIQNADAFSVIGEAVERGDASWVAAGEMRDGERVWAFLRRNREVTAAGDKVEPYIAFVNDHTGSHSFGATNTVIRPSCSNVLPFVFQTNLYVSKLAREKDKDHLARGVSFRHVGGVQDKLAQVAQILSANDAYMDEFAHLANQLASQPVTERELNRWVRDLWPHDEEGLGDRAVKNREEAQEIVRQLVTAGGETIGDHTDTAWGFVNAVGEYVDWGGRVPDPERRAERVLRGDDDRIKNRALALALDAL